MHLLNIIAISERYPSAGWELLVLIRKLLLKEKV